MAAIRNQGVDRITFSLLEPVSWRTDRHRVDIYTNGNLIPIIDTGDTPREAALAALIAKAEEQDAALDALRNQR